MKRRVTATEAAKKFSDILNRVAYRGETFVVERGGLPICEIIPARPPKFTGKDFVALMRSLPRPDKSYLDAVDEVIKNREPIAPSPWER